MRSHPYFRESEDGGLHIVELSLLPSTEKNLTQNFPYTYYKHINQSKTMGLSTWEFVRRFAMHILPKGFIRIRHFGILHSSWMSKLFPSLKKSSKNYKTIWLEKGLDIDQYPNCKKGILFLDGEIQVIRIPPNNKRTYENRHSL